MMSHLSWDLVGLAQSTHLEHHVMSAMLKKLLDFLPQLWKVTQEKFDLMTSKMAIAQFALLFSWAVPISMKAKVWSLSCMEFALQ
jgi:hypothetical protein